MCIQDLEAGTGNHDRKRVFRAASCGTLPHFHGEGAAGMFEDDWRDNWSASAGSTSAGARAPPRKENLEETPAIPEPATQAEESAWD